MKKFAILAIAALVAGSAFAQGIGGGGIYVNGDWYRSSDLQSLYETDPSSWGGVGSWMTGGAFTDLGTLTALSLGGQAQSYSEGDSASAQLSYSIDNGTATYIDLSYAGKNDNTGNTVWQPGGAGDAFAPTTIDISGLSAGNHTLAVQYVLHATDGNDYTDSVSTATFNIAATQVPEPATMSLLGLGALALVLRRKLRK